MLEAIKYSANGEKVGTVELDEKVFAVSTNNEKALLYEVINMYLANQRQGTSSVRGRSEVRGSTAKMYRQKGTGNARAGSRRSPVRVGGGVAFGPRPKDWYKKIPKKKKRLALKLALTNKAATGNIFVIESLDFEKPDTGKAKAIIDKVFSKSTSKKIEKKLLIINDSNPNTIKSFKNITGIKMDRSDSLFAYEVLRTQYVVFTEKALKDVYSVFGE